MHSMCLGTKLAVAERGCVLVYCGRVCGAFFADLPRRATRAKTGRRVKQQDRSAAPECGHLLTIIHPSHSQQAGQFATPLSTCTEQSSPYLIIPLAQVESRA